MTVYALDTVALYVGKREIGAYGEGGSIEIARNSELWENTPMTDGQIVSAKILDKSAIVTITLRYDSPSNQVLSRFAEARSTVDFSCSWPNGDISESEEARIQKLPDITDGQSPGDRQWQVFLANEDREYGVGA